VSIKTFFCHNPQCKTEKISFAGHLATFRNHICGFAHKKYPYCGLSVEREMKFKLPEFHNMGKNYLKPGAEF